MNATNDDSFPVATQHQGGGGKLMNILQVVRLWPGPASGRVSGISRRPSHSPLPPV